MIGAARGTEGFHTGSRGLWAGCRMHRRGDATPGDEIVGGKRGGSVAGGKVRGNGGEGRKDKGSLGAGKGGLMVPKRLRFCRLLARYLEEIFLLVKQFHFV